MALFARATSIFIVSNRTSSKLISPIVKSVTWKNLPSKFTFCGQSIVNLRFSHSDNSQKDESRTFLTFDNFLKQRRDEAKRSFLIQVHSESSIKDLHFYCSKFGEINCLYFYMLPNKLFHVLVEFKDLETVNAVLKSVTHVKFDEVIPAQSPLLYFRKVKLKNGSVQRLKIPVRYPKQNPNEKKFLESLTLAKSTSQQLQKCYSFLKLDDLGLRLRFHTAHQVERCFIGIFPNMEILPFGSTVNGFGKMGCDLDFHINFDSKKTENSTSQLVFQTKRLNDNERIQCSDFLRIIADMLETFVPGVSNVTKILKARVPIVKFNHRITGVDCDLSLSNMSAIYMSELLYLYGEIDWRVRPVVFTIRKWAQLKGITCENPGGYITNFSLTLLILFYLQQKKVLPTLLELRSKAVINDLRITDTNVDCTFLRDISRLRKVEPFGENPYTLLQGFFEYYSNFDFQVHSLCLREGTALRKRDSAPLYICNPLEPTLNVSRNVTHRELENIRINFREASWKLENAPVEPSNKSWGILALFENIDINKSVIHKTVNIAEVMREKYPNGEEKNLLFVAK